MTTFTPSQLRDMADLAEGFGDPDLSPMLRQAASDAEFRQFWESSGEDAARTPKEQTK